MTAADAFLRDILVHPDDDAPRLIFADWLDENGDPARAEFVRVQCELARLGPCDSECRNRIDYECRGCALRRRERELLPKMDPFPFLPEHLRLYDTSSPDLLYRAADGGWVVRCLFRRGFVECLTLSAEAWLAHADALTAAAPVREVTLTTCPDGTMPFYHADHGYRLLQSPRWSGITFHLPD